MFHFFVLFLFFLLAMVPLFMRDFVLSIVWYSLPVCMCFSSQFWKFAVTGCNQNQELKVWSCETWHCLQTIRSGFFLVCLFAWDFYFVHTYTDRLGNVHISTYRHINT